MREGEECEGGRGGYKGIGDTICSFNTLRGGVGSSGFTVGEANALGLRLVIFLGVCFSKVLDGVKQSSGLSRSSGKEEVYDSGGCAGTV